MNSLARCQAAALIPPPRIHRHRYHGVLAPNSPLRNAATAYGRDAGNAHEPPSEAAPQRAADAPSFRSPARYLWAMLLARLFASLPLTCHHSGADMRIVAFVTDTAPVQRILNHIGEPAQPPPIAPARIHASCGWISYPPASFGSIRCPSNRTPAKYTKTITPTAD